MNFKMSCALWPKYSSSRFLTVDNFCFSSCNTTSAFGTLSVNDILSIRLLTFDFKCVKLSACLLCLWLLKQNRVWFILRSLLDNIVLIFKNICLAWSMWHLISGIALSGWQSKQNTVKRQVPKYFEVQKNNSLRTQTTLISTTKTL